MQEVQFFGLYFPPLLVAVVFGFVMALVLVRLFNRLAGEVPCCGALATLSLTITLGSGFFLLMYL